MTTLVSMSAPAAGLLRTPPPSAGVLLAGYAADVLLGDPRRLHPVAGFGALALALERRLWSPRRSAGALYAGMLILGAALLARLAERALGERTRLRHGLAVLTLWTSLGGRSLGREGRELATLLERGELEFSRARVRALVGRDRAELDEAGVCRAAIESIAENTADALVAPLVWGAIAGSAGPVAYRAANTLDAIVGHRSPRHERFGWAAARLDDILTWPAARLGALLAVALAPAAGGQIDAAWRALRRDGRLHPSPNAGPLEAAFAGALGVRLGGRSSYGGRVEDRPSLGDGRDPQAADILRAARLSAFVGLAGALVSALLARTLSARLWPRAAPWAGAQ